MPPTDYKLYYIEHKQIISERARLRYIDNKESCLKAQKCRYYNKRDEILKKKKIKVTCDCGSKFRKHDRKRHLRSKKHIRYLQELALQSGLVLVCDIDNIE